MAFNPTSTIYLCNVPIDSTYTNQIYFSSRSQQQNYFADKVVRTFTNYLTVRKALPGGSLVSRVKVDANIDDLYNCNYMYYQNANHGTRFFYAFITNLVYINEGTTEIEFETDVYQTWLFDVELKQSYVVREHSENDNIGYNIVPEKFNFQDYVYQDATTETSLDEWGYLIGATEHPYEEASWWETLFGADKEPIMQTQSMSGIQQGLYFYYYPKDKKTEMNTRLNTLLEKTEDCIIFIAVVPAFCVSATTPGANEYETSNNMGMIFGHNDPAKKTVQINNAVVNASFEGYAPKNNKLFTAPYYRLIVSNHNGEQAEYNIEDFTDKNNIEFKMYGDISANPSITLVPQNYKGVVSNYDSGISISSFPQISTNTDTFKLWLAKNQYGMAIDTIGNVAQIIAGVAGVAATGGIGLAIGASSIVSGAQGVLSTINTAYQASREPNRSNPGGGKNNLLTAMEMNKFEYLIQTIKRDHAQMIDDFFTVYGYQTNKVKQPNVASRPYFNYVQTVDCNIVGAIPDEDMQKMKTMYNRGVTLWKPSATVGDYSVDNRPET